MNLTNNTFMIKGDVENIDNTPLELPFSIIQMSASVIKDMREITALWELDLDGLSGIRLGTLRFNAIRLHAVCRYKKGVKKTDDISPSDVRCIDIHPRALTLRWAIYARFLLFHEFLHALGFSNHGKEFKRLESMWPDSRARHLGQAFGLHLRDMNTRWLWVCPSCDMKHVRYRRSNGKYRCRECMVPLMDIEVNNSTAIKNG